MNLQRATVVSLYSGLGGAEVACKLIGSALHPDGIFDGPEFLLACDCNSDCQKVLQNHAEARSNT